MDAAEIAQRHARQRPGYELVSYREVALPLFRCELSAVVTEQKPIPPVQEFVLRAVAMGLRRHEEIAGLLGLEMDIARDAAVQLMRNDELALAPAQGSGAGAHALTLTTKGRTTAADLVQSRLIETEMSVYIDGLTREVVAVVAGRTLGAFHASEAKDRGLPLIHAHPRRPPKLSEVKDADLNAVLADETRGRAARRQIVGISDLRRAKRFARPGLALAFRSEATDELQVTLLVDGSFSEKHDEAFGRSLKFTSSKLTESDWVEFEQVAEEALSAEVVEQAASPLETEAIAEQQRVAVDEQREMREAIEKAHDAEVAELKRRLEEAERREKVLNARLAELSVRHVPVYEHPGYLRKAFAESKERVLLVSPWIRANVVDDSLLRLFETTAERGVKVLIGYGIGDRPDDKPNPK